MARYETTIKTPMSQRDAFEYMADLRNFQEWDPGVKSSIQVVGTDPKAGAEYDVKLAAMTLRYVTTEFDEPQRTAVEAHSSLLSSFDVIDVTETPTGSNVRYEATIKLHGLAKLADPLFGLVFDRIGDKAAAGMAKALGGTKVS